MDPRQLVDAQFDRAVEIVQGLPKSGPVQTGYEEKLAMYSLYKQATVGNVKGPRPALWDMLGRAKWDAWSKRKELDPTEAKWLYVDELLKVLRKPEYSDKPLARELMNELEAYGTGAFSTERSASKSEDVDDSSSSESESDQQRRLSRSFQTLQQQSGHAPVPAEDADADDSDDSDSDDDVDDLRAKMHQRGVLMAQSQNTSGLGRPPSSLSSQRYRTPMGSMMLSPSPAQTGSSQIRQRPQTMFVHPQSVQHQLGVNSYGLPRHESDPTLSVPNSRLSAPSQMLLPDMQPMPNYETLSAFAAPPLAQPLSTFTTSPPGASSSAIGSSSSVSNFGVISLPPSTATGGGLVQHPYPANLYPGHPAYRAADHGSRGSHSQSQMELGMMPAGTSGISFTPMGLSGLSRTPLERAVETVQAHVAALQERMEAIETRTLVLSRSGTGTPYQSLSHPGHQIGGTPTTSPFTSRMALAAENASWRGGRWWDFDEEYFDWEHMGLWSVVLAPLARLTKYLTRVFEFLLARRAREGGSGGLPPLSPGMVVLRRLLVDVTFILCLLAIGRKLWRKSGVRRQEVIKAFKGVWRAMMGPAVVAAKRRVLVDRGV